MSMSIVAARVPGAAAQQAPVTYHARMVSAWNEFLEFMQRGGLVMWPLLLLSVVSLSLIIERALFWGSLHRPGRYSWLLRLQSCLRKGELASAETMVDSDRTIYSMLVMRLIQRGADDASAIEAVEEQRGRIDRFMMGLSTIITASPMLGILGTVLGIIRSFHLLGGERAITDPNQVSAGIAEALMTTAFGLVVALLTLFPYMYFRGQSERCIGRFEALIAAAQQGAIQKQPQTRKSSTTISETASPTEVRV
ncbi:MAG: hypothetical protein CMJ32_09395 [Phycisphaerae bacterium]|nr:hypothetical protein [Phycisphaerae bacterium]